MPIRINLLAEEQAAEEMRRRDPVKRTIFVGIALAVLMLAWIAVTQMNVRAARQELAGHDTRLRQLDEQSKLVRANQLLTGEIDSNVQALERYSSNRFFWGSVLDAVQHISVDQLRLVEIRGEQQYTTGDVNIFFTTNLSVKFNPPPAWWKFWAGSSAGPSVLTLASNVFETFTNAPPFTTNVLKYAVKVTPTRTNAAAGTVAVRADFTAVRWAREQIGIDLRGRDYGSPAGAAIDDYARRVQNSEFFKDRLDPVEGLRMERPAQALPDPQDPQNPNALFVPFTIKLKLKERVLSND
jgi:hypothetical protein